MVTYRRERLIGTSGAYAYTSLTALRASTDETGHRKNMDTHSMCVRVFPFRSSGA